MIRKLMTGGLCLLLVNLFIASASAQTTNPKTAKRAEEIKAKVAKLGTGPNAKIDLISTDGTELQGFVSQINDEDFVVSNSFGNTRTLPYSDVKSIKGRPMSKPVKMLIAAGATFGVLFLITAIGLHGD